MRLLVIEDDVKIQEFISRGLRLEGHTVEVAGNGPQGLALWQKYQYDAIILDIMLPQLDGLTILKKMRHANDTTPVIVLSAKVAVDDRVSGLQSGADDYLIKPFSLAELSARLQTIVRRAPSLDNEGQPLTQLVVGELKIDLLTRVVTRGNRKIELQAREYALLELLMRTPERPVAKAVILKSIWNSTLDPQTNIVDVLVSRLRNKIDAGYDTKLIQTIRGVGYVLQGHK